MPPCSSTPKQNLLPLRNKLRIIPKRIDAKMAKNERERVLYRSDSPNRLKNPAQGLCGNPFSLKRATDVYPGNFNGLQYNDFGGNRES